MIMMMMIIVIKVVVVIVLHVLVGKDIDTLHLILERVEADRCHDHYHL